jgi:hypothetical protein
VAFVDSLVCADPNGPVTKAPGHEGPLKESMTFAIYKVLNPNATSNVRDSGIALARPVLS